MRARNVKGNDTDANADGDADPKVSIEATIVDQVHLAAVSATPIAPQQSTVAVDFGDDSHTTGAFEKRNLHAIGAALGLGVGAAAETLRSEERRVGKECRCRGSQ